MRIICKECKNYHPTALHCYQDKKQKNEPGKNDDEKKEETVKSYQMDAQKEQISAMFL